jgi:hypothetical protein
MLKEGDTLSLLAEASNSLQNESAEFSALRECVSATFLELSKKCFECGLSWSDIRRFLSEAIHYAPDDEKSSTKFIAFRDLLIRRVNNPVTKRSIEQCVFNFK